MVLGGSSTLVKLEEFGDDGFYGGKKTGEHEESPRRKAGTSIKLNSNVSPDRNRARRTNPAPQRLRMHVSNPCNKFSQIHRNQLIVLPSTGGESISLLSWTSSYKGEINFFDVFYSLQYFLSKFHL